MTENNLAERFRGDLAEASFVGAKKAAEFDKRPEIKSAVGAALQLGELGLPTAKPLGKVAVHGSQTFIETTPPELKPPAYSILLKSKSALCQSLS